MSDQNNGGDAGNIGEEQFIDNQDPNNAGGEERSGEGQGAPEGYISAEDHQAALDKANQVVEDKKGHVARLEKELEEAKSSGSINQERIDKLEIAQAGYTHEEDLEYIFAEAKEAEKDVNWIINNPGHKAILEDKASERRLKEATPEPGGRGKETPMDVDYYINNGTLPDDPKEANKVIDEMARREKAEKN